MNKKYVNNLSWDFRHYKTSILEKSYSNKSLNSSWALKHQEVERFTNQTYGAHGKHMGNDDQPGIKATWVGLIEQEENVY